MRSDGSGGFGRRLYRTLFTFLGPAQVGRYTPAEPPEGVSATLPPGYHFESYVDDSGIRRRIAVPDEPSGP